MEMICRGDRGSSAIWYDKKSKKRPNKAYLIGVAFLSHYRCGKSKMTSNKEIFGKQLKKTSVRPSRFVACGYSRHNIPMDSPKRRSTTHSTTC